MDPDWYFDHYPAPPATLGRRRRKTVIRMTQPRQRWRMTLDELCYAAQITPSTFNEWADQGLLGRRVAERPDAGRGRHITRETAQRTVLVARLVSAGIHPEAAGHVAAGHKVGDDDPLEAQLNNGVTVAIRRDDLP
jgi:hypothetical protein